MKQPQANSFHHGIGVQIAVPHSGFTPLPQMSLLEVAYHKGKEAKRLCRPPTENPHTDKLQPNTGALADMWNKGYNE